MGKIIFIVQNFFEDKDYVRYGIDIFRKKNIEIEVWSIVYLVTTAKRVIPIQELTNKINVCYPKSVEEIRIKICDNSRYIFLLNLNFFDRAKEIRKEIYKNKCRHYELKICAPLWYAEEYERQNILGKFALLRCIEKKSWIEIIQRLWTDFVTYYIDNFDYQCQIRRNKPQAIFCSTKYDKCHLPRCIRNCKIYTVHTLDYDCYLENKKIETKEKKYIVYIDDGESVEHPDLIHYGERAGSTKWKTIHRNDLCILMKKMEEIFKIPVVVAGHPRVKYSGNEYEDRKIIQFQTGQLVKDASIVIVSRSTAWNFIMLYDKPVLFYTTSRKPCKEDITIIEYYLKRKAIDIADVSIKDTDLKAHIKRINGSQRKKYICEYIKEDINRDTDRYFFDIVSEIIEKENGKAKR